jgi:hypothetical protein
LRNVKNGIALVERNGVGLRPADRGETDSIASRRGKATAVAIPPQDETDLILTLKPIGADHPWLPVRELPNQDHHNGFFYVNAWYTGIAGGQRTQAEVKVANTDRGWRVH